MKDKYRGKFEAIRNLIRNLEKELNVALPNNPHMRTGVNATMNELLMWQQNFERQFNAEL